VAAGGDRVRGAVQRLAAGGLKVSLFIDPDPEQVEASARTGGRAVELHTGAYCEAHEEGDARAELERLRAAAALANRLGLAVHAGHGLNVRNVAPVARIPEVEELNIGHALIGRAIFVGLPKAVAEMKELIRQESARR
jgi:pyridoxine 5-phosphate synthase